MRTRSLACWWILCVATSLTGAAEELTTLAPGVHEFITAYCVNCHGSAKEEGGRAFHALATQRSGDWKVDLADENQVTALREILDQLNLGEMPPHEDGVAQPSDEEIKVVTQRLTRTLLEREQATASTQTVLRRLNRNEYRNTMRDLLGLPFLAVDPTTQFPKDDEHGGFTNLGATLNLSDEHLAQYLAAVDEYLAMALQFGKQPESRVIEIRPQDWGYFNPGNRTPWMYKLPVGNKHFDIGSGRLPLTARIHMITYPRPFADQGGIQQPGYYKIATPAEAIRRLTHPYDPKMIPADLTKAMRIGLYVADSMDGLSAGGVNARRRLASWDLRDHEVRTFETTAWLAKGAIPFLHWENGPGETDHWMRDILKRYHTDVEFRGKQGKHAWHIKPPTAVPGRTIADVWAGPLVRIHDLRFVGPLPKTFTSRLQTRYLDGAPTADAVDLRAALKKFTRAAFRRPVSEDDFQPYLELAQQAQEEMGRSLEEALHIALKAILVSPDFLYFREAAREDGRLNAHELANRLSYFLWSSMPDEELFSLADSGQILLPDVLRDQVDRMLGLNKANAMIDGFCESWLQLDKLGSMPPDENQFEEFYRCDLEAAMRNETRWFARHILRENRPITDFLASRYTFLNEALARHYGIEGVHGGHFRKVSLPANGQRGGLLGQASVLTLTANGVDTTPIVRGVWVLEAILGTPPSPPPPDIEPLDPDVRGATTLRERLEKHRTVASCRRCHAKIDPFGFPLEFYDPVGGFRPSYYRKVHSREGNLRSMRKVNLARVDGSAELPSSEHVETPFELKRALLSRKDQFARALAKKLLTYACGRSMALSDQAEIDRIAAQLAKSGYGFRDLVFLIVSSDSFQKR
ncbi:MAG: DUF1592 domain-containing protein [Planctomycetota bacterium]